MFLNLTRYIRAVLLIALLFFSPIVDASASGALRDDVEHCKPSFSFFKRIFVVSSYFLNVKSSAQQILPERWPGAVWGQPLEGNFWSSTVWGSPFEGNVKYIDYPYSDIIDFLYETQNATNNNEAISVLKQPNQVMLLGNSRAGKSSLANAYSNCAMRCDHFSGAGYELSHSRTKDGTCNFPIGESRAGMISTTKFPRGAIITRAVGDNAENIGGFWDLPGFLDTQDEYRKIGHAYGISLIQKTKANITYYVVLNYVMLNTLFENDADAGQYKDINQVLSHVMEIINAADIPISAVNIIVNRASSLKDEKSKIEGIIKHMISVPAYENSSKLLDGILKRSQDDKCAIQSFPKCTKGGALDVKEEVTLFRECMKAKGGYANKKQPPYIHGNALKLLDEFIDSYGIPIYQNVTLFGIQLVNEYNSLHGDKKNKVLRKLRDISENLNEQADKQTRADIIWEGLDEIMGWLDDSAGVKDAFHHITKVNNILTLIPNIESAADILAGNIPLIYEFINTNEESGFADRSKKLRQHFDNTFLNSSFPSIIRLRQYVPTLFVSIARFFDRSVTKHRVAMAGVGFVSGVVIDIFTGLAAEMMGIRRPPALFTLGLGGAAVIVAVGWDDVPPGVQQLAEQIEHTTGVDVLDEWNKVLDGWIKS